MLKHDNINDTGLKGSRGDSSFKKLSFIMIISNEYRKVTRYTSLVTVFNGQIHFVNPQSLQTAHPPSCATAPPHSGHIPILNKGLL